MERAIRAVTSGIVRQITVGRATRSSKGTRSCSLSKQSLALWRRLPEKRFDLAYLGPDLAEVIKRHEIGLDSARPL